MYLFTQYKRLSKHTLCNYWWPEWPNAVAEDISDETEALWDTQPSWWLSQSVERAIEDAEIQWESISRNIAELAPDTRESPESTDTWNETWENIPEFNPSDIDIETIHSIPWFENADPDDIQAALELLGEEWFEIPEWMSEEDAYMLALNELLDTEPSWDERVTNILEEEGINLTDEQRQQLDEFLEGIENPTIWDIQRFLEESWFQTMEVPDIYWDEIPPNFLVDAFGWQAWVPAAPWPVQRWRWNGENPFTWEVFRWNAGLNEQFYNVQTLREWLSENVRREADQLAEMLTDQLQQQNARPENWLWALYRNASNNPDFRANQPVLLHNISTATALVVTNNRVELAPATHGKWVWNVAESHSTSIGSFQLYAMDNWRFQARIWVHGLESMWQNVSRASLDDAYNMDPSRMWNSNSNDRLIRVHEARWSMTHGCSWLPLEVARRLAETMRSTPGGRGIMERFVSQPSWA